MFTSGPRASSMRWCGQSKITWNRLSTPVPRMPAICAFASRGNSGLTENPAEVEGRVY